MKGLFQTFKCTKCNHVFESCLDICSKCGSIAYKVGGIEACLDSGRPPGYAGGRNDKYSARSYDRCMEANFKALRITDCVHKEGPNGEKIPHCTFGGKQRAQAYDSAPNPNPGQRSFPIRAYHSPGEMSRAISEFAGRPVDIPMTVEGKPFSRPNVHPEFQIGTPFSAKRPQTTLQDRTLIVARHRE